IRRFCEDRTERLKAPANRHRKSILNDKDRAVIADLVGKNPQLTGEVLCRKVLEICSKKVSSATMYRELVKIGYSHITQRPRHYNIYLLLNQD
ncbi:MAG: hypothetical protein LBF54_03390, partial [Holosporaceae bacterium]|nr:hypothetical protein [Holosporaceae bacterium]